MKADTKSDVSLPAVSIIMPVYNPGAFLEDAVASCLRQTLQDIEVICVDDGSTDGSLEVLNRFASTDSRVKVFAQSNAGAARARNLGLAEAQGEFVFFLDSDDYIPSETALERLVLAAHQAGTSVSGGSMVIDRAGKISKDSLHGAQLDSFAEEGVLDYRDYQYDYDFTRYIYRRRLLEAHDIGFPERTQFEDPVFFVHAMLAAGRFAAIPDAVYAYRYAYRRRSWSVTGICDRLDGTIELLELSSHEHLAVLHAHLLSQLEDELASVLYRFVGCGEVMTRLYRANTSVNTDLLKTLDPTFPSPYIISILRDVNSFYSRIMPIHVLMNNRYVNALKRRLGCMKR